MIDFYNQVPSVYVNASRDFQYLSWLINIVLNSVKHNVDDLYGLPGSTGDPKLSELLATTLGFKVRRNYDQRQLLSLVSIIPSILRYKGTTAAIEMAAAALINTSGSTGSHSCKVNNHCVEVLLPKNLVDTTLFVDLLPYILPAGMTCKIVRRTEQQDTKRTDIGLDSSFRGQWFSDTGIPGSTAAKDAGLSTMFAVGEQTPTQYSLSKMPGSNTISSGVAGGISAADTYQLYEGLLDNTVIPVIGDCINTTSEEE